MNRDTAETLMKIYGQIGALFNDATSAIATEPDASEQRRLRQPVGMAMAQLWTDLQLPIISAYPDLHPDNHPEK